MVETEPGKVEGRQGKAPRLRSSGRVGIRSVRRRVLIDRLCHRFLGLRGTDGTQPGGQPARSRQDLHPHVGGEQCDPSFPPGRGSRPCTFCRHRDGQTACQVAITEQALFVLHSDLSGGKRLSERCRALDFLEVGPGITRKFWK